MMGDQVLLFLMYNVTQLNNLMDTRGTLDLERSGYKSQLYHLL